MRLESAQAEESHADMRKTNLIKTPSTEILDLCLKEKANATSSMEFPLSLIDTLY